MTALFKKAPASVPLLPSSSRRRNAERRRCVCRAPEQTASGRDCETHLLVLTYLSPIGSTDATWRRREGKKVIPSIGWIGSQKSNFLPAAHYPRFRPSLVIPAINCNSRDQASHPLGQGSSQTPVFAQIAAAGSGMIQTSVRDTPVPRPSVSWTYVGDSKTPQNRLCSAMFPDTRKPRGRCRLDLGDFPGWVVCRREQG